jgi:predicted O-methyltransferase YrrM
VFAAVGALGAVGAVLAAVWAAWNWVVVAVVVMLAASALAGWWYLRNLGRRLQALQDASARHDSRFDELQSQGAARGLEAQAMSQAVIEAVSERAAQSSAQAAEALVQTRGVQRELLRRIDALPGSLLSEQQALTQLLTGYPPRAPLPIVAGWAMVPSGLLWLVDYIEQTRPQLVVECGSGTTTLWICLALERAGGGRLVSLEHSEEYAARTQELLDRHGVAAFGEIRHAPLTEVSTKRGSFSWYGVDPGSLTAIDLLVVDGPPGATGPLARYPAMSVLGGGLKPAARVVADDVDRPDEQEVIRLWLEDEPRLSRAHKLGGQVEVLVRAE